MGATAIIAGITAAASLAGTAASMKIAHDQKKEAKKQAAAQAFNAEAENKKAALQEAEANRRRAMSETDTVQTTALGNAGQTELKKKTLLGG